MQRTLGGWIVALALSGLAGNVAVHAQPSPAPRPDVAGYWFVNFITPLERPPFAPGAVVTAEQEPAFVEKLVAARIAVIDPDVAFNALRGLNEVNGERRTSILVSPADGRLPYNAAGLARLAKPPGHDGPEQRPPNERCISGFIAAPYRPQPRIVPLQIVQTDTHLVLNLEETAGLRIVPIGEAKRVGPSFDGASAGRWDGATLVIETRGFHPETFRENIGPRAVHLSQDAVVTERLTRVADDALLYQYEVVDPALYTGPWRGEFVLSRYQGRVAEYACHEGNAVSMEGILVGGRIEEARKTNAK